MVKHTANKLEVDMLRDLRKVSLEANELDETAIPKTWFFNQYGFATNAGLNNDKEQLRW